MSIIDQFDPIIDRLVRIAEQTADDSTRDELRRLACDIIDTIIENGGAAE